MFDRRLHDFPGERSRLSHAQTADGVARKTDSHRPFDGFLSQFMVHSALHDTEKRLMLALINAVVILKPRNLLFVLFKIILAALRPAQCEFHRLTGAFRWGRIFSALIERHNDVGAQSDLRFHRALRTE